MAIARVAVVVAAAASGVAGASRQKVALRAIPGAADRDTVRAPATRVMAVPRPLGLSERVMGHEENTQVIGRNGAVFTWRNATGR